jgi:hypothetical protein
VINIIGQVIGKSIEIVGVGLMYGTKAIAGVTRSVFFISGKNVDMVDTLREIRNERISDSGTRLIEVRSVVMMPPDHEWPTTDEEDRAKIVQTFRLIQMALEYSSRACEAKILPIEEIMTVDRQAINMANAIRQYLRKQGNVHLVKEYGRTTDSLARAASLCMKYHESGNKQVWHDAQHLLKEIYGIASEGEIRRNG